MPQPLPHFDNNVDPLLPNGADLKPLLYYFDDYQTYDLIAWDRVTRFFSQELRPGNFLHFLPISYLSNFRNEPPYYDSTQHVLIERFTPWSHPWAEHYATELYNFINTYSGTDYYGNIANGYEDFGMDRGTQAFQSYSFQYESQKTLELNLPATSVPTTVIITWLEKEVNFRAVELKKSYVSVRTLDVPQKITLALNEFITCSAVVSSNDETLATSIEQQLAVGHLYKNLTALLDFLHSVIQKAFPRLFFLLESYDYEWIGKIRYRAPNQEGFYRHTGYYYGETQVRNFKYRQRPSYYRSSCLLYANNNYWLNGNVFQDLGKIPVFWDNGSFDIFRYYLLVPQYNSCFAGQELVDTGIDKSFLLKTYVSPNSEEYYDPSGQGTEQFKYTSFYDTYNVYFSRNPNNTDGGSFASRTLRGAWSGTGLEGYGEESLLKGVTGGKIWSMGIGNIVEDHLKSLNTFGDRTEKYYSFIVVMSRDMCQCEFAGGFEHLGTKFYTREEIIRFQRFGDGNFFQYDDEQIVAGTQKFIYYDDDSGWADEPLLWQRRDFSPEPIKRLPKLTDAEVIQRIDVRLYSRNFVPLGQFDYSISEYLPP